MRRVGRRNSLVDKSGPDEGEEDPAPVAAKSSVGSSSKRLICPRFYS